MRNFKGKNIYLLLIIFIFTITSCSFKEIYKSPLKVGFESESKEYNSISITEIGNKEKDMKKIKEVIKKLSETEEKGTGCLRIASFNLLSDSLGFDGIPVKEREESAIQLINSFRLDVLGVQEMSRGWYKILRKMEPSGLGFVNPFITAISHEMTGLLYNKNTLTLIKSGDISFEKGDDFRLRRAAFGVFAEKSSGKKIAVINTHLSISEKNPKIPFLQAQELLNIAGNIKNEENCPVVILGDFNARERNEKNFASSALYEFLQGRCTDVKTISPSLVCGDALSNYATSNDHIFAFGNIDINIKKFCLLSQRCFEKISDHYLIFCEIKL